MAQVVIENPIFNSPFDEPRRHFRFTEEGITDEIVEAPQNVVGKKDGEGRKDAAAKTTTAHTLWAAANNNHGGFGRWAFIRSAISGMPRIRLGPHLSHKRLWARHPADR